MKTIHLEFCSTRGSTLGRRMVVWVAIAVWVISILMLLGDFSLSELYAQADPTLAWTANNLQTATTDPTTPESLELIKWLEVATKSIYLIMWPAIAIAWASLDNSLVYWGALNLEWALYAIRNMMRTFANFWLWLTFVWWILYSFFKFWTATEQLTKIVKNVLISVVVINLSRFIVAATLDVATILTVQLGSLPMTVETRVAWWGATPWETAQEPKSYLFPVALYDLSWTASTSQANSNVNVVYSCNQREPREWETRNEITKIYYAPCIFESPTINGDMSSWWKFSTLLTDIEKQWSTRQVVDWKLWPQVLKAPVSRETLNSDYCYLDWKLIRNQHEADITDSAVLEDLIRQGAVYTQETHQCQTAKDVFSQATKSSWPLFALYASVFDMASLITSSNSSSIWAQIWEMMLKSIIWLALLLPLLTLAIVLVYRVVLLRIVIVFSPILAIVYIFGLEDKLWGWMMEKFSLKSVVSMIFLPVTVVFAISISLLFLSLLHNITVAQVQNNIAARADPAINKQIPYNTPFSLFCHATDEQGNRLERSSEADKKTRQCNKCGGLIVLCMEDWLRSLWTFKDVLSWLVINLLWVGVMRVVIFAALKSAKFSEWIVWKIQDLAQQWLQTVPIIPIPGVSWWMSVGALKKTDDLMVNKLRWIQQAQYNDSDLKEFMDKKSRDISGETKAAKRQLEESPMALYSASWWAWMSLKEYDGQVDKIREEINKNLAEQWKPTISSSVDTMEELLKNKEFVEYSQTNHRDWYKSILRRFEQWNTSSRKRYSQAFVSWLNTSTDSDSVYLNGADQEAKKWKNERTYSNGLLTKLKRSPTVWVLDFDWIEDYLLPAPGEKFTTTQQVNEYVRLMKSFGEGREQLLTNKEYEAIDSRYWSELSRMIEDHIKNEHWGSREAKDYSVKLPVWDSTTALSVQTTTQWGDVVISWITKA